MFSLLLTNKYSSAIRTSSIQCTLARRLPAQLSLLILCYLDDNYMLLEIQKQFYSVESLHRIRTTSTTNNTTLVRLDFELVQECDGCLNT